MKVTIVIILMLTAGLLPLAVNFMPAIPDSYSTGAWLGTIILLFIAAIVLDRHKRQKEKNIKP
ncbi:hypothetical protein [Salinicoccus halodurans]|uniref:Uncharacterized protein n=1 Tax=Salinicoccus halodurans TaxID=407035 RepID=A0A0F7HIN2_9STAP|nr:hypothetical protein [Salinicoccus halodurans]AKG72854.1 hypothetical protein AAT16_00625 [Salinicoccus halodurans]SFK75147.1 hypothetical protein SAMN05216235_1491 [Salinicoccus halodurans]